MKTHSMSNFIMRHVLGGNHESLKPYESVKRTTSTIVMCTASLARINELMIVEGLNHGNVNAKDKIFCFNNGGSFDFVPKSVV